MAQPVEFVSPRRIEVVSQRTADGANLIGAAEILLAEKTTQAAVRVDEIVTLDGPDVRIRPWIANCIYIVGDAGPCRIGI